LDDVRNQQWLEVVAVDSLKELIAFSDYVRILGSGGRNIGEASILAWAEVGGGVAIMDDHAAVNAARSRNVAVRRSLGLLCNGLHKKTLTMEDARSLVDELASIGGARFPCDGAGFEAWAENNGLLALG
jgi:predicted nucleic acid-binding protein